MEIKKLSKREQEILAQIALGYTAKEIASFLHVAVTTIQSHLKNIKKKLNAKNNCNMIYLWIKNQ